MQNLTTRASNMKYLLALLLIGLATAFLYWPGLSSGFYLDDSANLKGLALAGSREGALAFVFNNENPRYLSYLSFLPQYEAWIRQDPFPFKLLNLAIHLTNTLLVFLLTTALGKKLLPDQRQALWVGSLATLAWAISPMHVNSVLYVIQRMTLLSSMFMLLAMLYFVRMPCQPENTTTWLRRGLVIGIFYTLGILCKENAILIGAHLAVLMLTINGRKHIPAWWITAIVVTPLALTIAYLFLDNRIVFGGRDFTLQQRLLTESRILLEYIRKILFALPQDISLHNDAYPVIRSIADEKIVLLYMGAIIMATALSLRYRSAYPVAAFALLWFFAGHLLESTFIPLELYFEHRNYLPSLGLFFGLAFVAVSQKPYKIILWPVLALLLANSAITSNLEIASWKDREQFAMDAILDRPHSTRAMQLAAEFFLSQGDVIKAASLIRHSHDKLKPYSSHLLYLVAFKCMDDRVEIPSSTEIMAEIRRLPHDRHLEKAARDLFGILQEQHCSYFSWQDYDDLLQVLQQTAPPWHTNYYRMFRIFAYQQSGNIAAAQDTVTTIDISTSSIDQGFFKIYMLLEYDKKTEARQALEMLTARFHNTRDEWLNRKELAKLQKLTSTDNGTERSMDTTGTGTVTE